MVKQERKLKTENGILAELPTKPGRSISNNNTIEIVHKYYENEEISRMLPGKKDFVSRKVENVRVHKQERLILMNLNELYTDIKEEHPDGINIGILNFCELLAKNYSTVGSRSHTQYVYVKSIKI